MKQIIRTEDDKARLLHTLSVLNIEKPQIVEWKEYSGKRSNEQNALNRLWVGEAAEQLGWEPEHMRAYCKLHYGIPILRAENPDFCRDYDKVIRPLAYEDKLRIMSVPIDFPVTRLMSVKQEKKYLDAMYVGLSGMGVLLSDPESRGRENYREIVG